MDEFQAAQVVVTVTVTGTDVSHSFFPSSRKGAGQMLIRMEQMVSLPMRR